MTPSPINEVFGIEDAEEPPSGGSYSVDAYKARIKAALEAHVSERKPKLFEKTVSREQFWGLGEQPEKKVKADLNGPAKDWMKKQGWEYERCDYFDARTTRHHDLLGMFDYLAFTGEGETVGVQITSKANMATRRNKVVIEKRYQWVKRCGWRVLVLGLYKDVSGKWQAKADYL